MVSSPALSLVVVEFNMSREIPRTLLSLSPRMQKGVEREDYEIILVDNGSSLPSDRGSNVATGADIRFLRVQEASVSPARAINRGIDLARGELIGVMIDGARMVSPGILAAALSAARLYPRAVISPLGFHLGSEPQNTNIKKGYDQSVEDEMLERIEWTEDGYRLFEISVVAPGNSGGWYNPIGESTALFMRRELWAELDGYDERFEAPGGGLVTYDTYLRACELPSVQPVMLVGEGTFHQVHGGVASNAAPERHPWNVFHDEYLKIRGKPYDAPRYEPLLFGKEHAQKSSLHD